MDVAIWLIVYEIRMNVLFDIKDNNPLYDKWSYSPPLSPFTYVDCLA